MPVQLDGKPWVSGAIIDDVDWCTNGHWLMQAEYVKVPPAGLRAWANGEPWSVGRSSRSPVKPETFKDVLREAGKGEPGEFSDFVWHGLQSPMKDRVRLAITGAGVRYAWFLELYLPKAGVLWTPLLRGPLDGVGLRRTVTVDGKTTEELMGVIMPMNLGFKPNTAKAAVDKLHRAMAAQAKQKAKAAGVSKPSGDAGLGLPPDDI